MEKDLTQELEDLSLEELKSVVEAANKSLVTEMTRVSEDLEKRWAAEDASIRETRKLEAAELGLTYREVRGERKSPLRRRSTSSGVPKFKDPASGRTWTGRGRVPGWIIEHEAQGGTRNSLLIGPREIREGHI